MASHTLLPPLYRQNTASNPSDVGHILKSEPNTIPSSPPIYIDKDSLTEGCMENLHTLKREPWKKLVTEITLTSAHNEGRVYTTGDTIAGYVTVQNKSSIEVPFRLFSVSLVGWIHLTSQKQAKRFVHLVDFSASSSADIDTNYTRPPAEREGDHFLEFPPNRFLQPHSKYKRYFLFTFPEDDDLLVEEMCCHANQRHATLPPTTEILTLSLNTHSLISYSVQTHIIINTISEGFLVRAFAERNLLFSPRQSRVLRCDSGGGLKEFVAGCKKVMDDQFEKQKRMWKQQQRELMERRGTITPYESAVQSSSSSICEETTSMPKAEYVRSKKPTGSSWNPLTSLIPPKYRAEEWENGYKPGTYESKSRFFVNRPGLLSSKLSGELKIKIVSAVEPLQLSASQFSHKTVSSPVPLKLRLEYHSSELDNVDVSSPPSIVSVSGLLISVIVESKSSVHDIPIINLSGDEFFNNNGKSYIAIKRELKDTVLPMLLSDKETQQKSTGGGHVPREVSEKLINDIDSVLNVSLINRECYPGFVHIDQRLVDCKNSTWESQLKNRKNSTSEVFLSKEIEVSLNFDVKGGFADMNSLKSKNSTSKGSKARLTPSFQTCLVSKIYVVRLDVKFSNKVCGTIHLPVEVV
ncbi:hypothetical protein BABINDRAFT_178246 [Babjeviella inositovora NRRL Y-12698]|uniref:Bul1 N-terminal domain-containing protein n=1 Tax=Babjeviella inositovora NRRL Y-12698 TaxID=984486 RepID=A0A1E3QIV7_9ASCO|nr:uncharacterized protein BABINDRAFT_178246 [Babjeviella inositovora NRRL Y-12698]ODQ77384.1 hypothetical protein BABINDRAFT_178246 [Babjeviella inositovora NRRL Y-12698]